MKRKKSAWILEVERALNTAKSNKAHFKLKFSTAKFSYISDTLLSVEMLAIIYYEYLLERGV